MLNEFSQATRTSQGLLGLFLATALLAVGARAQESAPIENFHEVSPGVYRGSVPDQAGRDYLKKLGIKTVISLQALRQDELHTEKKWADSSQIKWVHEAIPAVPGVAGEKIFPVKEDQINRILAVLTDTTLRPVYVHCYKGEDRTGFIVGLFRVLGEHKVPADAYKEMLDLGFHVKFTNLVAYFKKRTGFQPPTFATSTSN